MGQPGPQHMGQMGLFGTCSGLQLDDENKSLMIMSNGNHSRELVYHRALVVEERDTPFDENRLKG